MINRFLTRGSHRRGTRGRLLAGAAVVLVLAGRLVGGQSVEVAPKGERLRGAEFSHVSSVRELSGARRVVITDDYAMTIQIGDFEAGGVAAVGRAGDGPGEYRTVGAAFALGSDTTLVTDGSNKRWLIIAGATPTRTITLPLGNTRGTNLLCGTASRGAVTCVLFPTRFRAPRAGVPLLRAHSDAESVAVVRLSVSRRTSDTIAVIKGRFRSVGRATKGGVEWIYYHPLGIGDQAQLFDDGWTAVVRSDPFSISWLDPSGASLVIARLPARRVAVDERQKRHILRSYEPGLASAGFVPSDFGPWPELLPAFPNGALHAAPDGSVLIERMRAIDDRRVQYDLVDRRGRVARSVYFPPGTRVVGLSRAFIYVSIRDQDDIERIERYSWPE